MLQFANLFRKPFSPCSQFSIHKGPNFDMLHLKQFTPPLIYKLPIIRHESNPSPLDYNELNALPISYAKTDPGGRNNLNDQSTDDVEGERETSTGKGVAIGNTCLVLVPLQTIGLIPRSSCQTHGGTNVSRISGPLACSGSRIAENPTSSIINRSVHFYPPRGIGRGKELSIPPWIIIVGDPLTQFKG